MSACLKLSFPEFSGSCVSNAFQCEARQPRNVSERLDSVAEQELSQKLNTN
jgi:hypothetical protein